MKINSDMRPVTSDRKNRPWRGVHSRHLSPATRHSQKGVALIITLILLSVTLVMAIAFLAISRRERASVTTSTDTITARLAADDALAKATAQIIATIYANTNPFVSGLIVSTNYQNAFGFVSGVQDPTNVNYDYVSSGGALDPDQFNQNVANLLYLPRAPVFVTTNRQSGSNEFRFYLDVNRNARFEANGNQPVVGQTGGYLHPNGSEDNNFNNVVTNFQTGDPEWIGILERPDVPHGPNNKFVSRYAFVAMPADNALDLNAIHNQTQNPSLTTSDGYFRNEGVGSWELNLAAFLTDLNTNEWDNFLLPYDYNQANTVPNPNTGYAFEDARALLSFRYNFNYNSQGLLAPNFYSALVNYGVDGYTLGNLMTRTTLPFISPPLNGANTPWAGSDNTNHFFALPSDLFDTTKITPTNFINRLNLAGNGVSTYDRYTFYRMLAQLGTDSSPESGKMNLNYDNLDNAGNVIPGAETNLIAWTPIRFFNSAADRMLREYTTRWFQGNASDYYTNYTSVTNYIYLAPSNYLATYFGIHTNYFSYIDAQGRYIWNSPDGIGLTSVLGVPNVLGLTSDGVPSFGIANIPVQVNGRFGYSSAVQRVLQLAANMFDATTNQADRPGFGKDYPSVFRPLFTRSGTNVFITSYDYVDTVSGPADPVAFSLPFDVADFAVSGGTNVLVNVYGVPWIIGAKKGFPNFNEFSMDNTVQITRKLQIARANFGYPPQFSFTNVSYVFGIGSSLGIEFWNSYTNNYPNPCKL